PRHEEAAVGAGLDGVLERAPEAWPAGAALVLRLGVEQRLAAPGAKEQPLALLGVQRARSRRLGAMLAQHVKPLRRQLRRPFLVRLLYWRQLFFHGLSLPPRERSGWALGFGFGLWALGSGLWALGASGFGLRKALGAGR